MSQGDIKRKIMVKEVKGKKDIDRVKIIKESYLDACEGNIMDAYHAVCEAILIKDLFTELVIGINPKEKAEQEAKFAEHYFNTLDEMTKD